MLHADVGIGPWHPLLLGERAYVPPHPMIMPVPVEAPRSAGYSPEQVRQRSREQAAAFRATVLAKVEDLPTKPKRRTRTKAELAKLVTTAQGLMAQPGAKLKVVAEIVGVSAGYLSVLLNRDGVAA